jgi:nucleoside-diphosphate kinase
MKTQQRTLAIIKPDAVKKNATGDILSTIHKAGFHIIGLRMMEITEVQDEGVYGVHANKHYFS